MQKHWYGLLRHDKSLDSNSDIYNGNVHNLFVCESATRTKI